MENSIVSINDSEFMSNYAFEEAGAIQIENSDYSLIDTDFDANFVVLRNGGALFIKNNEVVGFFKRCHFNGNEAMSGGAIYVENGDVILEESSFEDNEASSGGAIYGFGCNLKILECGFNGNLATLSAGAVHVVSAVVLVENSNFESKIKLLK